MDGKGDSVIVSASGLRLVLVAACALIDPDGRVLVALRPPDKSMAGLWEFPGGKVEVGERPEETVIREDLDTGAVSGAIRVRVAQLRGLSSSDAALRLSTLGGFAGAARAFGAEMGKAERAVAIPDAARRPAADPNAARSALRGILRNTGGATAIEYALIASLISILIIAGVTQIGTTLSGFFQTVAASI
jgi:Flp pilus assembly pilin Flp